MPCPNILNDTCVCLQLSNYRIKFSLGPGIRIKSEYENIFKLIA